MYNELADDKTSLNDCDCNCGTHRHHQLFSCYTLCIFHLAHLQHHAKNHHISSASLNSIHCFKKGSYDPDCQAEFDDIYCVGIVDEGGAPLPIARARNLECKVTSGGAVCEAKETLVKAMDGPPPPSCPQLPDTSPQSLNRGSWNNPPYAWTCEPERYYQIDCPFVIEVVCDCGCGRM